MPSSKPTTPGPKPIEVANDVLLGDRSMWNKRSLFILAREVVRLYYTWEWKNGKRHTPSDI